MKWAVVLGCVLANGSRARASSIDKEVIRRVVRSHHKALARCYESNATDEGPQGKLIVRFHIDDDGVVTSATKDASSTLSAAVIETCFLREIRTWRFPATPAAMRGEGGIEIVYPFFLPY